MFRSVGLFVSDVFMDSHHLVVKETTLAEMSSFSVYRLISLLLCICPSTATDENNRTAI